MELKAILAATEESGAGAVIKAFDGLKEHNRGLARELQAACDAYFADVERRQTRIRQRIADLGQQHEDIERKIRAMQPALVDATVSGNAEAFKGVQKALADLEAAKAAIGTQLELLTSAVIPGDETLFAACEEKQAALSADNELLREAESLIHDLAKEQHSLWGKLEESTCVWGRIPGSSVNRYDKVREHFCMEGA